MSLAWSSPPARLAPGQAATLRFTATNETAGHKVPTGDPERFLLLKAEVRDATGQVLAAREVRIGAVYQWSPFKLLSDNRLAPGEARSFELNFQAPAEGTLTLALEASKHRISAENLAYHHLEGRTVPSRVYLQEELRVPVADE